jgi:hypothetical protein
MENRQFAVVLAAILTVGLGTDLGAAAPGTDLDPHHSGPLVAVSVVPGPAYLHKVKFGLFSMTLTPQTAIWIETSDGRYVDTIYVTEKAATGKWSAAGGARRPETLPVWSHARGLAAPDGLYMPDKANRLPDAVSGATAKSAFTKTWQLPAGLVPGSYRIRVELNSSYDWNEAYPDKLPKTDPRWSEVNGQPSIVWECALELGDGATRASLAPIGTGAIRGEDGALRSGLEGITSARDLAASIEAEYRP